MVPPRGIEPLFQP